MIRVIRYIAFFILISFNVYAQNERKATTFLGDWQMKGGKYFAQIYHTPENVFK